MASSSFPYGVPPGGATGDVLTKTSTADAACDWQASSGGGGTQWPIGSVFLSMVPTNPATLLGVGTWAALATGRFLVGLDPNDPDFDTVRETGGAKTAAAAGSVSQPAFTGAALATHTHGTGTLAASAHAGTAVADHPAHTHGVTSNVAVADHAAHTHGVTSNVAVADHASHTHTYTDVPNHVHPLNVQGGTTASTTGTHAMTSAATGGSARAVTAGDAVQNPTGGVAAGTTAGPGAALTHTVTNNAVTSGNPSATLTHAVTNNAVTSANPSATLSHTVTQPSDHTLSGATAATSAGTPAGTVSQPTFTGSPTAIVPPYLVVYMWERVA